MPFSIGPSGRVPRVAEPPPAPPPPREKLNYNWAGPLCVPSMRRHTMRAVDRLFACVLLLLALSLSQAGLAASQRPRGQATQSAGVAYLPLVRAAGPSVRRVNAPYFTGDVCF